MYKPQFSNQSSCHMMLLLLCGIGVEVAFSHTGTPRVML